MNYAVKLEIYINEGDGGEGRKEGWEGGRRGDCGARKVLDSPSLLVSMEMRPQRA